MNAPEHIENFLGMVALMLLLAALPFIVLCYVIALACEVVEWKWKGGELK